MPSPRSTAHGIEVDRLEVPYGAGVSAERVAERYVRVPPGVAPEAHHGRGCGTGVHLRLLSPATFEVTRAMIAPGQQSLDAPAGKTLPAAAR